MQKRRSKDLKNVGEREKVKYLVEEFKKNTLWSDKYLHELAETLCCPYENIKHWYRKTISAHCNKIICKQQAGVADECEEGEESDQPGLDIPLSLKHRKI